jgi:hypothetical protein
MAKGGQGKGKALGKNKSSSGGGSSYSPPSSISRPSTPRTRNNKVSYGQGAKYSYSKEGKLIMPSKAIKITNKGRRRITMNQAYCMKCRKKVEMMSPKQVTMKNGRPATQGTCPVCGTKVFRIGK